MSLITFTEEQKEYLKDKFGIDIPDETIYKILNGTCTAGDTIWWLCTTGPEKIVVGSEEFLRSNHPVNMKQYPHFYSIKEPIMQYSGDFYD